MAKYLTVNNKEIDWLLETLNKLDSVDGKMKIKLSKRLEKLKKRIKVRSAKNKGANLQKKVCEDISTYTGIAYNQSDDDSLIHSREMGQHGTDIVLRGEAKQEFPFSIECKNVEGGINLTNTIDQARSNLNEGTDWLIVQSNKALNEPIVTLAWSVFMNIFFNKGDKNDSTV